MREMFASSSRSDQRTLFLHLFDVFFFIIIEMVGGRSTLAIVALARLCKKRQFDRHRLSRAGREKERKRRSMRRKPKSEVVNVLLKCFRLD